MNESSKSNAHWNMLLLLSSFNWIGMHCFCIPLLIVPFQISSAAHNSSDDRWRTMTFIRCFYLHLKCVRCVLYIVHRLSFTTHRSQVVRNGIMSIRALSFDIHFATRQTDNNHHHHIHLHFVLRRNNVHILHSCAGYSFDKRK